MFDFLRVRQHDLGSSYDFLRFTWLSILFSVVIFTAFIGTYLYRYFKTGQAFNYSVEFTGGIQALLKFNKPVKGDKLVHILSNKGWPGIVTREFSDVEHLVRVKKEAKDVRAEAESMRLAIKEGLPEGYTVELKETNSIGGATGAALWSKSFYAIMISLIAMLIYIGVRFFSFAYAMGAIVSLFHDAIVILAVFLILDKEISINVIGAILAVLGYSINDTIVVFARVRENMQRLPSVPLKDVINLSITETLSRTLLTTFATLLVVVALFIFGGETLRDLSFALLIGIIFGIYSTIFIANPVLFMLHKRKEIIK